MSRFHNVFSYLVLSISIFACCSTTTFAQTKIGKQAVAKAEETAVKLEASCKSDVQKFCKQVTLGDGRLVLCMLAHEDKISTRCYGALFDVADGIALFVSNVKRASDQCDADIDKFCGKIEPGEGRIAQCLVDNKSKVSTSCRAEIAAVEARLKM
jgi:hypothetical protein